MSFLWTFTLWTSNGVKQNLLKHKLVPTVRVTQSFLTVVNGNYPLRLFPTRFFSSKTNKVIIKGEKEETKKPKKQDLEDEDEDEDEGKDKDKNKDKEDENVNEDSDSESDRFIDIFEYSSTEEKHPTPPTDNRNVNAWRRYIEEATNYQETGKGIGGKMLTNKDFILYESDLSERFIKGGGNGGQKVNKSHNCVLLNHLPTGTMVKCHATRSLAQNRRMARKIMKERLELLTFGRESRREIANDRKRKRKSKKAQRTKLKYGTAQSSDSDTNKESNQVVKKLDDQTQDLSVAQAKPVPTKLEA